jgi:putative RNA 2'-phosphotransferase
MLKECNDHGYFRGDACPECGEPGKFLMNDQELEQIGRTMAGVLRHFPDKFELEMDDQGFVDLKQFVKAMQNQSRRNHWIRPHHIIAIIETDPKGRYQVCNDMIRATYGHSIELNLKLPTENVPDTLYYPTTPEEADIVLETGLKPSDRKMVHLSKTYQDAMNAGRVRTEFPVILEIDAAAAKAEGINIGQAGRTVYLALEIPASCLKRAEEVCEEEVIND